MKHKILRWLAALSFLATLSGLNSTTHAADIRQGLVAYWQMEGTDGIITPDATSFSNHLRLVNMGPGNFVAGQFGNAVSLNGTSTYLTNLHSTDPAISGLPIYRAGSYTISMWVRGAAQTGRFLFAEGNTNAPGSTAGQNPLLILQTGQAAANNNKFDVIIRNDAGGTLVNHVVSSSVVFDNTWHHVAWVDDRGSVKLYVDGNLDSANFNYTPSGNFTLNTTTIGALVRANVAGYFNGFIDDVALWRRALTQAEVQEVRTNSLQTPIPLFPAIIVMDPVGSTNQVGDRVTFTASAEGATPITYQWLKNGAEILGANTSSLSLSNLIADDSGDYALRVANLYGTNVSRTATLFVASDPAPDLRQRIVSYWPVDEQLEDEFARPYLPDLYSSNHFKVVANTFFLDLIPGVQGNAVAFNDPSQYAIRQGGFPIYATPTFTVAMWVNAVGTNQVDRKFFVETATNSNNTIFSIGTHATGTNGTIRILVRNALGGTLLDRHSTRTVLDGNWHHIAYTENNGQGRLYIDGLLDETSFFYTRETLALDATTIGAALRTSGSTNSFNGLLDEIGTWGRALSFSEVQMLPDVGIPAPAAPLPPTILSHPMTQSVFTRASVALSFTASGAGPLYAQWRKDGTNLPGETNITLLFSNISLSDAGAFDVLVTNAVGRATSQVATLTVTARPITTDLKIDFNNLGLDDSPATTQPGFSSFTLPVAASPGPITRTFGGAHVTLSGVGGISMQSRRRTAPVNAGGFTEERLLQDFVFAPDTTLGQGLDVAIDFLEPNQTYTLTIWSYDNANNARVSDWTANGTVITNGYLFNGTNLPTSNAMYQFSSSITADAQGSIRIQARRSDLATAANNVFLNALQIIARGELRITRIERVAPSSLRLTFNAINPAATHGVQEKTSVDDPLWTDVTGAVFSAPNGNTIEVTLPIPATNTRFYRVVETPAP